MSADNGIYILNTKDSYRVIHAQAIDNLYYSPLQNFGAELVPTRVIEYFGNCRYTRDKEAAYRVAEQMAKKYPVLEYGINLIESPKSWKQIVIAAKELAQKELQYYEGKTGALIDYRVDRLEKIALI